MKLWIKYLFVFLLFTLIFPSQKVEARSGCCSRHGGVCGCGCCDGSGLSATCSPYYPECSGGGRVVIPTSKPIIIPTRIPTQRPVPTYKPIPTLKPIIIPTQRPIPTLKPIPSIRPTSTPKPTLVPTITIAPSPTEIILPTEIPSITPSSVPIQSVIPTVVYVPQVKSNESQSIFSRFFAWLFNRH